MCSGLFHFPETGEIGKKCLRTLAYFMKHSIKRNFKYYVVQFLELPDEDVNEIVCIPWMWIVSHRRRDLNVLVSYPIEDPSDTEKRVKDREIHKRNWKSYKSVVIYATDSFQDAKDFSAERMNENHFKYNQCVDSLKK